MIAAQMMIRANQTWYSPMLRNKGFKVIFFKNRLYTMILAFRIELARNRIHPMLTNPKFTNIFGYFNHGV